MLSTLLGCMCAVAVSTILLTKSTIIGFINSMYTASKVSLGIAIPLVSI